MLHLRDCDASRVHLARYAITAFHNGIFHAIEAFKHMNKKDKINIVIVDDHPLVRDGIKRVIEMEDDMTVCGEAEDANRAIKSINSSNPDIVTVDISLNGDINGIELLKAIKERYPDIKTIVLSIYEESLYAERAIRAGARGYIMKKEASVSIIDAIRRVMRGDLYLSAKISSSIIQKLVHGSTDTIGSPLEGLTDREFDVFQLIGNGYSSREIAEKFNRSIHTVESHKKHIREKLNLKHSAELTKHAVQWILTQYK